MTIDLSISKPSSAPPSASSVLKIGVMGGTFDPIHTGHLIIAQEAGWQLGLDKVLFVPAGDPPHKQNQKLTPAVHRLAMVRLATQRVPLFEVSTIEIERQGLSYTADTLAALRELYPLNTEFYFIIGADAAAELGSWRQPERVLELAKLALAERRGYHIPLDELTKRFPTLPERLIRIDTPMIEIASHEIRERMISGAPISYLISYRVETYIREHQLYIPELPNQILK